MGVFSILDIQDIGTLNPLVRGGGRSRKTVGQSIKRDLEVNGLSLDLINDRTLWCWLTHVAECLMTTWPLWACNQCCQTQIATMAWHGVFYTLLSRIDNTAKFYGLWHFQVWWYKSWSRKERIYWSHWRNCPVDGLETIQGMFVCFSLLCCFNLAFLDV